MNHAHEFDSPADAIRAGAHAAECPVREHADCVRQIVHEELQRARTEREAQRFQNLKAIAFIVLLLGAAVAADKALR